MGLSIKFLSCILLFYLIIAIYAFCYILSAQKRGQTHSPLLIQRSLFLSKKIMLSSSSAVLAAVRVCVVTTTVVASLSLSQSIIIIIKSIYIKTMLR